jgi:hypothetical protein
MITFFTIPKPFTENLAIIQRNAIISWLKLLPDCEIILYGDEEGIAEISDEFGLIQISDIRKNEYGTPFLDFVFNDAQLRARNPILCYANTDIIFFKDLINSITSINKDPFLAVGQRWDIDVAYPLNFSDDRWEINLRMMAEKTRSCSGPFAIDFFVFPKTAQLRLIPFLVGRAGWDNWMIYHARKKGILVIDITQTTMVVHQKHHYNHVPLKKGKEWQGPESDYNLNQTGNKIVQRTRLCIESTDDAEYMSTDKGIVRRQKGLYKIIIKKTVKICPVYLYPIIAFLILTIARPIVIIRNKFRK